MLLRHIQPTSPLLLHKPCNRFASVARVCQRQLVFHVIFCRYIRDLLQEIAQCGIGRVNKQRLFIRDNRKPYMQAIEWCHFRWPWVTPDPGFEDTVVKRRISPKRRILQRQLLYRTLIRNHRQAIDRQATIHLLQQQWIELELTGTVTPPPNLDSAAVL